MDSIANYLILVASAITILLSWLIYWVTRSKGVLLIFIAMILGFVNRILVIVSGPWRPEIALIFWVLWAIGLWLLYQVMIKYTKPNESGVWNRIKRWLGVK